MSKHRQVSLYGAGLGHEAVVYLYHCYSVGFRIRRAIIEDKRARGVPYE